MSCTRVSLLTNVTREPVEIVTERGDTPLAVIVIVDPDGVGVGLGVVGVPPPPPPQAAAVRNAAAAAAPRTVTFLDIRRTSSKD
jgi:hypothetical protein